MAYTCSRKRHEFPILYPKPASSSSPGYLPSKIILILMSRGSQCDPLYCTNKINQLHSLFLWAPRPRRHGTGTENSQKTSRSGGEPIIPTILSSAFVTALCCDWLITKSDPIRSGQDRNNYKRSQKQKQVRRVNESCRGQTKVTAIAQSKPVRRPRPPFTCCCSLLRSIPRLLSVYLSSPTFDAVTVTLRLGYARSL